MEDKALFKALSRATQSVCGSTGMQCVFTVRMVKADGSDPLVTDVTVVARSMAESWEVVGLAMQRFMNGPHGRVIQSITRVTK